MGSTVRFEDSIVEMFYAQAQPSYSDFLQCFQLRLSQRAWLALERDFFGILPAHMPIQAFYELVELLLADIRRSTSAKIGEFKLPALQCRGTAVDFVLFNESAEITLYL